MIRVLPSIAVACFFLIANCLLAQDNPPQIFCPNNFLVNLDPGACEEVVNFTVFATDDNSTPAINQLGPPWLDSGDNFPIGTTTLTYQAVDNMQQTDTCSFTITVVEYLPPTSGLVCDDFLNISIPSTCEMFLLPSMVLEGNYGCYEDFVVDVENTGSNYIGPYYVGETISYTVINTETGNSCWGEALIEDKSGPLITGCDSVFVNCLADTQPVSEGGDIADPSFSDCHSFTFAYLDEHLSGDCTDSVSTVINRTWTATDELGNVSSCTQVIVVERIFLTDIAPDSLVCPADTLVECQTGADPDLSPAAMGYPVATIGGVAFEIRDGANSVCNITASYNDLVIDACGSGYKILRTWSVIDWCLPIDFVSNPRTCTQLITYMDTTDPEVAVPSDLTASANLPGCRARPTIPASTISDCSQFSVFISTPVGPIVGNGGQIPAPGLPIGNHTISVTVTDACGNATTETFQINVVDLTKPSPVCDAHTVVSLDDTGYAFANATTFDDGSTDNCCIDGFEVRRLDDFCGIPANTVFGDYIEFCCADVGQSIDVVLRVYDCNGNFNDCQVEVEVQDIAGPSITCPPNRNLVCGDDVNNPAIVGTVVTDPAQQGPLDGLAQDNCGATLTIVNSDEGQVSCGAGTIYRTYAATDAANQTTFCVQTITVTNNNPFTGMNIQFPADITVSGCGASTDPANTGLPVLPPPSACYTLVSGQDADLILSSNDACRKILRTWYVIDWCQYDANDPNSEGIWTNTQTITVVDQEGPSFPTCANRTFCNFHEQCNDLAPDLSVSATDLCTDDALLFYTWTVDLYNDGLPDPPGYATSGAGQNTTNAYPVGVHQINYTAFDGCGNQGSCSFLFAIDDCKKPTIFCESVNVSIMQTGMVPVSVLLLEEGSSRDNCTARADLQFSFSPDVTDTLRIFTCNELGANLVQVWATDEAGNQDFCETTLNVQDNMGACGGAPLMADLSGAVTNEDFEGLEEVSVELNGNMTGLTSTSSAGVFQFANVPVGNDYSVTPALNVNPRNGVTTFDIYLLNRHVLGIQPLSSPYQLIAGDASHNDLVTVSDVVEIRKLILHITNEFSNNTSWRFVDAGYSFPDPLNPFSPAFPEVCNVNDLALNSPPTSFIGVKIGDVNGSAATGSLLGGTDDRSEQNFVLRTTDRLVKAGETFTVDFTADLTGMVGYQFTMQFDQHALDLQTLVPGRDASEENFGLAHLDQGLITASWYQIVEALGDAGEPLFSLTFRARADGELRGLLGVNSRLTTSEGYEADGTLRNVQLAFAPQGLAPGEQHSANTFELFQNVPNPFGNTTAIGFQLPETTTATLTIFDLSGRELKRVSGLFAEGYHEVKIGKDELGTAGVFYYRLETPGHTATMKMTTF